MPSGCWACPHMPLPQPDLHPSCPGTLLLPPVAGVHPCPPQRRVKGPTPDKAPTQPLAYCCLRPKATGEGGCSPKTPPERKTIFKKRRGRQGKGPKRACQACVCPGTAQPMSDLGPHSRSLRRFTCQRSEQVTGSEVPPSQDTLKPGRRDDGLPASCRTLGIRSWTGESLLSHCSSPSGETGS